MKQVDSTIIMFKDSFRMIPAKSSSLTTKHKQQDRLKQRAEMLKKQIESLKAKTSVDMVSLVFLFELLCCKFLILASHNA